MDVVELETFVVLTCNSIPVSKEKRKSTIRPRKYDLKRTELYPVLKLALE